MIASEHFRIAYAFYMGGLTFKEVGLALKVSTTHAQEMVKIVDKILERTVRSRERELHRESPRSWYARRTLGIMEDLPKSHWGGEAEPRHDRPRPRPSHFIVHLIVAQGRSWKISCDDHNTVPNIGDDRTPVFKLSAREAWTRTPSRVTCKACMDRDHLVRLPSEGK